MNVSDEELKWFDCEDCAVNTLLGHEYYMVHNHVWYDEAGMDEGMLCIGCLEIRLGRQLRAEDFMDVPIHFIYPQSARLANRLVSS